MARQIEGDEPTPGIRRGAVMSIQTFHAAVISNDVRVIGRGIREFRKTGLNYDAIYRLAVGAVPDLRKWEWADISREALEATAPELN